MSTAPDLIAEIAKNGRECFRIQITDYKGARYVDVRVWYGDPADRKPSAKGVTLKADAIPAVIAALQEAQARLGGSQ